MYAHTRARAMELAGNIMMLMSRLASEQSQLTSMKQHSPELFVGEYFTTEMARKLRPNLLLGARADANWLAKKCLVDGFDTPDSPYARIVATITELCYRLETECGK